MKFSAVTIPSFLILAPVAVLAVSSRAAAQFAYEDCWKGCKAALGACSCVADQFAVMSPFVASHVMLKGVDAYVACDVDCLQSFYAASNNTI